MEAVLFDLGHTLIDYYCDWRSPEQRGVERIYQLVNEASLNPVDRNDFTEYLVEHLVYVREKRRRKMVEVPLSDILEICFEKYSCLDEAMLQEGLEIFYNVLMEDRRLVPGALEMLQGLKDRGLTIGLISDVAFGLPSEFPLRDIKHFGLEPFFDDMIFSSDIGLRKPHPKIFKTALSNLKASAFNSMYVGNSLFHDIKGAQGVGMRAVLKRSTNCVHEDGIEPDHIINNLGEIIDIVDRRMI